MKKIFFVLILFLFPVIVNANDDIKGNDIYLESIKLGEYSFTPEYHKYQNTYTIISNDYQNELKIYVTKEDETDKISIVGNNNLGYGENKIDIIVYNEEYTKENIYTFYITFIDNENEVSVFNLENPVEENSVGIVQVSGIVFCCYTLIMLSMKMLFFDERKKPSAYFSKRNRKTNHNI